MHRQILFVTGVPRSGTTATADLLCRHSRMIVSNEQFFNLATKTRMQDLQPSIFERDSLLYPTAADTHNWQWVDDPEYHGWLLGKYDHATVLGDKVPDYLRFYQHLLATFENAKILFVLREIKGVAASYKARQLDETDTDWAAGVERAVEDWNWANMLAVEHMSRHPDKHRIAIVGYERLFANDATYLAALLNFIGVDHQDAKIHHAYQDMTAAWEQRRNRPSILSHEELTYIDANANHEMAQQASDIFGL